MMKKENNQISFLKLTILLIAPLLLIFFEVGMIFIGIKYQLIEPFLISRVSELANETGIVLFFLSLIIFIYYLPKEIIEIFTEKGKKKNKVEKIIDIVYLIIIYTFYLITIFKFWKNLCGREGLFDLFTGINPELVMHGIGHFIRSHIILYYVMLNKLVPWNVFYTQLINRFFWGIMYLLFLYKLLKKELKYEIIIPILLILNQAPLISNFNTVEFTFMAHFGIIYTLYYLFALFENSFNPRFETYLKILIGYIITVAARNELSIIFGFFVFYCIFLHYLIRKTKQKKMKKTKHLIIYVIFFNILILLLSWPLLQLYATSQDPYLKGTTSNNFITGILYRLKQNIIINKELHPKQYLNFFSYVTILSFIPIILLFGKELKEFFRKKERIKKDENEKIKSVSQLFLLGMFEISYILILISFQIEGLRSIPKYTFHIYVISTIYVFFLIKYIFNSIVNKLNKKVIKRKSLLARLLYVALLIFIVEIELNFSPHFLYHVKGFIINSCPLDYYKIHQLLKKDIDYVKNCYVLTTLSPTYNYLYYVTHDFLEKELHINDACLNNPFYNQECLNAWKSKLFNYSYHNKSCILMLIKKYDDFVIRVDHGLNLTIDWINQTIQNTDCRIEKVYDITNDTKIAKITCENE